MSRYTVNQVARGLLFGTVLSLMGGCVSSSSSSTSPSEPVATTDASSPPASTSTSTSSSNDSASGLALKGPGFKQEAYSNDQLFSSISIIDQSSGVPKDPQPGVHYGITQAFMLNGYLVVQFAPDGGVASGGFLFYDLSEPSNPKLVKRVFSPDGETKDIRENHAIGVAKYGDRQYVSIQAATGFEIWDFTDINRVTQVSKLELPNINSGDYTNVIWQQWWQAPYLYLSSSNQGLFIIDTKDPMNPKIADRNGGANPIPISELGNARIGPLFTMGNQLILSSMENSAGITSLDISDPVNPILLANYPKLKQTYYATCFDGNTVFSSGRGSDGITEMFDLSDPNKITAFASTVSTPEQLYCARQDGYLFLGNQDDITKVDVSNLNAPRVVGSASLNVKDSDHGQVIPFGNLVFVGNDHGSGSGFIAHDMKPDSTPPTVIQTSPRALSTDQAVTSRIGISFSDLIDPDSVTPESIIVRARSSEAPLEGQYSIQLGIVNFSPTEPLLPNTEYEVMLAKDGVADYAGNALSEAVSYRFTTGNKERQGLAAFWSFDRNTVETRSAKLGEPIGNVTTSGVMRLADNGYLDTGVELSALLGGDATLSFHLKTTDTGNDVAWTSPGLIGTEHQGKAKDMYWGWMDAQGHLRFSIQSDEGVRSSSAINDDQWHHVVLSRSADTGELRMYVDGELQDETRAKSGLLGSQKRASVLPPPPALLTQLYTATSTWHSFVSSVLPNIDLGVAKLHDLFPPPLRVNVVTLTTWEMVYNALESVRALLMPDGDPSVTHLMGKIVSSEVALTGSVDHVSVFNRALSEDDIASLFDAPHTNLVVDQTTSGDSLSVRLNAEQLMASQGSQYQWSLGDGSQTELSANPSYTHTYDAPGHYRVELTVQHANGEQTSLSHNITVSNPLTESPPHNSSPIVGDEEHVYAVNADNDSLTAINADNLTIAWELALGDNSHPMSVCQDANKHVYVTLSTADQVVKVSPQGERIASLDLPTGSRPAGVVCHDGAQSLLVALQGRSELIRVDLTDFTLSDSLNVDRNPRGLAVTADQRTAYVTHFKSSQTQGMINVIDLSSWQLQERIPLAVDTESEDTADSARGVPNYINQLVISPDGLSAAYPANKSNVVGGVLNDGVALRHDTIIRSLLGFVDLARNEELVSRRVDIDNRSPGRAVLYTPLGDYVFVALQGSNIIELIDAYDQRSIGGNKTGLAPDGLHLHTQSGRLFVNNFMGRSVSVFNVKGLLAGTDFSLPLVAEVTKVADEKLADNVLAGKQLFYRSDDPRLAKEHYISCAGCHDDGGEDNLVWDFTDRGEGLRNTISLRGRQGMAHGPLHWSGNFDEVHDFEHDIRDHFGGTGLMNEDDFNSGQVNTPLGDNKAGLSDDLDHLSAYVSSLLAFDASPYKDSAVSLSSDALQGKAVFDTLNCGSCHSGEHMTDSATELLHDVGTLKTSSGQRLFNALLGIDTPTLRGVWNTPPYFHDGSANTLREVIEQSGHGNAQNATEQDKTWLIRYLMELD